MQLKKLLKNQKGFSLVEVIAAFSISLIVLTTLVSLALFTMRSSLQGKLLLESTKMASRELERVRAFRDQSVSWTQFLDDLDSSDGDGINCTCASFPCVKKCYMSAAPNNPTLGSTVESIDNQPLTRYFNIVPDSNDPQNIVRVSVTVEWKLGTTSQDTFVYTDLSNWEPK